jgi:predicted SnoaL-like aldol condensation-catalyzing enzyme
LSLRLGPRWPRSVRCACHGAGRERPPPTDTTGQRQGSLYLEGIQDGNYREAINKYAGARYTQHSTSVRDGKEGFIEFFSEFVERNPTRDIEIVRGFEDGQHVFLHAVQTLNEGESRWVTADIFDTDADARMIEHWDIIGEWVDVTVSGHTQVDGPTDPGDLGNTEANKQLITRFVDEVLIPGDYERLTTYVVENLVQHNPLVDDGREVLSAFAEAVGPRYAELHKVVGCGDFVATLAESEMRSKRHAVIDLYRVDRGMIVERWDVIEEITPQDTWVNSGKF